MSINSLSANPSGALDQRLLLVTHKVRTPSGREVELSTVERMAYIFSAYADASPWAQWPIAYTLARCVFSVVIDFLETSSEKKAVYQFISSKPHKSHYQKETPCSYRLAMDENSPYFLITLIGKEILGMGYYKKINAVQTYGMPMVWNGGELPPVLYYDTVIARTHGKQVERHFSHATCLGHVFRGLGYHKFAKELCAESIVDFPLSVILHGDKIEMIQTRYDGSLEDPVASKMTPEDFLKMIIKIGSVLSRLHRHGIVHGDLKDDNILIKNRDGSYKGYLSDFDTMEAMGRAYAVRHQWDPASHHFGIQTPFTDLFSLTCSLMTYVSGSSYSKFVRHGVVKLKAYQYQVFCYSLDHPDVTSAEYAVKMALNDLVIEVLEAAKALLSFLVKEPRRCKDLEMGAKDANRLQIWQDQISIPFEQESGYPLPTMDSFCRRCEEILENNYVRPEEPGFVS